MSTSCRVVREYLDNERVVWTVDSQRPGPVIVFTANIHGDECTGVAIINQLLATSKCVTLLVKEENVPARKCYERVGFEYGDPYRLYSFQEIKEA